MKTYFSPSTSGFYTDEIHGDRLAMIDDPDWVRPSDDAGNPDADASANKIEAPNPDCKIPLNAVEITAEVYASLLAGQASGKIIVINELGVPVLADRQPPSYEVQKALELATFRADREKMLNRLAGIGMAAQQQADIGLANAVVGFRRGLLDLPSHSSVVAATTLVQLRAALKARYDALLAETPTSAKTAFKGVDA